MCWSDNAARDEEAAIFGGDAGRRAGESGQPTQVGGRAWQHRMGTFGIGKQRLSPASNGEHTNGDCCSDNCAMPMITRLTIDATSTMPGQILISSGRSPTTLS